MDDTSLESNGADVASQEDLSLFDEEILFDHDPNDAYFRYMVGDEAASGDDKIIENEEVDESLQDWMQTPMQDTRKTLPPLIMPPPEAEVAQ